MNNSIVYSSNWCEQVFENRNKMYGAFVLRQQAASNTLKGLSFAILILVSAVALPLIIQTMLNKNAKPNLFSSTVVTLSNTPDIEIPKQVVQESKPVFSNNSIRNMLVKPIVSDDVDLDDKTNEGVLKILNDVTSQGDGHDTGDGNELLGSGGGNPIPEDTTIYNAAGIEQLPEFPGGETGLLQFIANNTSYPHEMIDSNIDGTVYISFVINTKGEVANVSVMRGISASKKFEKEATRVVSKMPIWKPGKQNGHHVNVQFMLPIRFMLR